MSFDEELARWGVPPEPVVLKPTMIDFLLERVGPLRETPQYGRVNLELEESRLSFEVLAKLAESVGGDDAVTVDPDARLAHSGGFSYLDIVERRGESPAIVDAVVSPANSEHVASLLAQAEELNLAVVPFGGGTSVVGGVRADAPDFDGVVAVAFDRMASVTDLNKTDMTVTVGPGMTGPDLEEFLNPQGLTLGHFPQSWERASIGGYAATRSSGQASSGYGRSNDMIESLSVVTPTGTFNLGVAPGTAAGPDLRQVFIGSEGAFGLITSITLRLRQMPEDTRYEGVMFPDYESALSAFRAIKLKGIRPAVMRLSDPEETLTNLTMAVDGKSAFVLNKYLDLRNASTGKGCLAIFSWEGSSSQVTSERHQTWRVIREYKGVSLGRKVGNGWQHSRFAGPFLRDSLMDNGYLVETLETATRWSKLPELRERVFEALRESLSDGGRGPHIMSHLSHVYDTGGSLYITVVARRDLEDPFSQWERAKQAACEAIVDVGATITHHHAVGRDHAPYLAAEIGDNGVDLLCELKAKLDPKGIMNPGVLVGPRV